MTRLCSVCLKAGTGSEMRCGPLIPRLRCDWCGQVAVTHAVERGTVTWENLPTVGEEDEGLWWLKWPTERQGPFPSARAAWTYWHQSLGGTRHCEDDNCRVCGKPKRPRTEATS